MLSGPSVSDTSTKSIVSEGLGESRARWIGKNVLVHKWNLNRVKLW